MTTTTLEAKKHALRQAQSGEWVLSIVIHPQDEMPVWLLTAPMGQRLGVVVAPLHEDQERAAASPTPPGLQSRSVQDTAPEAASPSRGGEPGGAGQVASPKERTPWRDMKIVTRAAMMCEDARSWPVLRSLVGWPKIETAEKAAEALRLYCDVESRKDIINKPVALQRYMAMESHYLVATGRMAAP